MSQYKIGSLFRGPKIRKLKEKIAKLRKIMPAEACILSLMYQHRAAKLYDLTEIADNLLEGKVVPLSYYLVEFNDEKSLITGGRDINDALNAVKTFNRDVKEVASVSSHHDGCLLPVPTDHQTE